MAKKNQEVLEETVVEEAEAKDTKAEDTNVKSNVEKKIRKQIEKKQEKNETLGIYRIAEYLKEEHKWENYLFVVVSLLVLLLGCLILNGSLEIKENFPLIGGHPTVFAWVLVGISVIGLIYALFPFYKPAFPEFKKITWLTFPKFVGNTIRVFLFLIIFVAILYLYDSFLTEIFMLVFKR